MSGELARRPLGTTGVDVTVLGFGAMELRGTRHRRPRELEAGQVERVLNAVLDAGINFVDTSIDYGDSEAAIGRAIAHRRDEFVLATKAGCPLDAEADQYVNHSLGTPLPHDYSRANLVAGLEQSLRRLRTDYVDLLQLHISPPVSVLRADDVIATLEELREQGKVRFIGISSKLPDTADHVALGVFDTFQVPYSALEPDHALLLDAIAAAGTGVVVRGGVSKGAPGDGHGADAVWRAWEAAGIDELVAELPGETRTTFLLRHTLGLAALSTTIVGTADVDHLNENVAAARRGPLDADLAAEVARRLAAAGVRPAPLQPI